MKKSLITTTAAAVLTIGGEASAQLWDPIRDVRPEPNFIAAFDTSVSMAEFENPGACNSGNCHPTVGNRLVNMRARFAGTPGAGRRDGAMYPFRDLFVFGGFAYSGANYAKIKDGTGGTPNTVIIPTPANRQTSYDATLSMIDGLTADYCVTTKNSPGCSERYLLGNPVAGTVTVGAGQCITPTALCSGDRGVITQLFTNPIAGLTIPTIPPLGTSTTCTRPVDTGQPPPLGSGVITQLDPMEQLLHELATAGFYSYPRYQPPNITGADIQADICSKLDTAVNQLRSRLSVCLNNPTAFLDLSSYNCVPGQLAGSICAPSSPFAGTCVCDQSNPLCQGNGTNDVCGPYVFKARQQAAMCMADSPNRGFRQLFQAQPDNVVNGECRANMIGYFTDGHPGVTAGVIGEATANATTYRTGSGAPLNYVFRASTAGAYVGWADAIASTISGGQNPGQPGETLWMRATMSGALNRANFGTYGSAPLAFDRNETRVAIYSWEIPGRHAPNAADYLGRPGRISWHRVDPDTGTINQTPIFETDWTGKAGMGRQLTPATGFLGPNGAWVNGRNMIEDIPADRLDRTGDGARDSHPPVTWGYMLGSNSSQPVIVEGARDFTAGLAAGDLRAYQAGTRSRPRVIYALSNGYLHAFHAGNPVNTPQVFGRTNVTTTYDDDVAEAGTELFRYRPAFIDALPDRALNIVVQQNLMLDGQIAVREVKTRDRTSLAPGAQSANFSTILVFSQGSAGRGYAALDVTDPRNPSVLWDRLLDGGTATSEPALYTFPDGSTKLVITGGVRGPRSIFAYDVTNGQLFSSRGLGGTADYRVSPVCVDATGRGAVTHCYALAGDGRLVRVTIDPGSGAFSAAADITPTGIPGGLQFWTRPAVFFGTDNVVNLAYGSGDINAMDRPSGQNYLVKVRDPLSGRAEYGRSCGGGGAAFTSGLIPLPANRAIVSPPVVSKGVLAWSAYAAGSTGCDLGDSYLYAIRFDTCRDLLAPSQSAGVDLANGGISEIGAGRGVATTPYILRASERIVARTSNTASAQGVGNVSVATQGGRKKPIRPIYWRLQTIAR